MGGQIAKFLSGLWAKKPSSIVMIGLENAGKTTVFRQLSLREEDIPHPIVGLNVETIIFENLKMTIWNLGSPKTIQSVHTLQSSFISDILSDFSGQSMVKTRTELCWSLIAWIALEYVVDKRSCVKRVHPVNFMKHFNYQILNVPSLILANKQDDPQAVRPDECSRLLGLADLPSNKRWHIQGCSALLNQGITDGFRWLAANV
ncbi:putative ADP-ribosylation factor 3 [Blattamonas nauphoetae]|uniref:ADP-ribosylation factor 3 n=1 Tax=Blattamonas nauphoetae TaxID=2049346 RepID=A0ABQ9XUP9_9EUKA|nr:putative ADP-ribosylation factor 3 [Blattamonas nauphoetae]